MEDNKECHRLLQHLQAQLEKAQEQKKNVDPTGMKKRLEDYEQMLQQYTLMRTNNKMKDFKAKSKE